MEGEEEGVVKGDVKHHQKNHPYWHHSLHAPAQEIINNLFKKPNIVFVQKMKNKSYSCSLISLYF